MHQTADVSFGKSPLVRGDARPWYFLTQDISLQVGLESKGGHYLALRATSEAQNAPNLSHIAAAIRRSQRRVQWRHLRPSNPSSSARSTPKVLLAPAPGHRRPELGASSYGQSKTSPRGAFVFEVKMPLGFTGLHRISLAVVSPCDAR